MSAIVDELLRKRLLVCLLAGLAGAMLSSAQAQNGGLTVLRTGGTNVIESEVRLLPRFAGSPPPILEFDFGFATDEAFAPGQFFDSVTATLQTMGGSDTAILFVIDASGLVLAPPTPGTVPLDPSSISLTPVLFPPIEPALRAQSAFHLSVPLLPQFDDEPVNLIFDLFDNQNQTASLGWINNVVVVPEPAPWILGMFVGLSSLLCRRWRRK